jgi:hypothetical protein
MHELFNRATLQLNKTLFRNSAGRLSDEQILEKLLALNLERAAAEKKSTDAMKKRTSRARTADEMI